MPQVAPSNRSTRPRRAPTLVQIAKLTGVHVSTVSRVLRQPEPPDGWTETAQVILRVAQELGYRPNLMAASLRTRKTLTVGVVMSRLTDFVMASMYQALASEAALAGYQVLLSSPHDEMQAQQRSMDLLLDRQIDGLVLASVHRPSRALVENMDKRGVPVLLVSRHGDYKDRASVTCDDRHGGYLATRHLLDLGHRRIGVVAGPRHASTANDRIIGVRDALAEAHLPLSSAVIINSDFEVQGGQDAGQRLLSAKDRPTAIFAVSDTAATAVMKVARDMGLDVPRDLSVVGYNDIPLAAQLSTPLTTISSPYEELGRAAMKSLLDMFNGKPIETKVLPVRLIVRSSTAPPSSASRSASATNGSALRRTRAARA